MKHIYLLSITLLVLWGCGTENTPTFTLTTTVSPSGAGTILPTQTTFDKGEKVTLQANPASGWTFLRWEGDVSKPTNPLELTVDRDYRLVGVFEQSGLTDIDGNAYAIVQIGTQTWMAQNLRTSRYRNGDVIPNVTNNSTWAGLSTGAWAHYNNDIANESVYGKLYNWYAVADNRGLCPLGWQVPSANQWAQLVSFLGSDAGHKSKSTTGWGSDGNGSNDSGFNGLPAGSRGPDGLYYNITRVAYFWSSTETNAGKAITRRLYSPDRSFSESSESIVNGFSIRCIRD